MGYQWDSPGRHDDRTKEILCPYCNKTVGADVRLIVSYRTDFGMNRNFDGPRYYILECPSCNKPSINCVTTGETYPHGMALSKVKYLSKELEDVYNEVRSAIAAGCYTSAVIVARTAIMHIAVDVGAEQNKSFQFYVDYLCDNGYLPPNAKAWVDKVRTMANDAVHKLEIWGKEDAELIGKFLRYMLVFIYELPASV